MVGCSTWELNDSLRRDLENYVLQGIQIKEILDFMYRDYQQYVWSIRTLDRRLRKFGIYYIDMVNTTMEDVRSVVKKELDGPGRQLGYRALRQKIRQKYAMKIPRDAIHNIMYEIDPDMLNERRPGTKKERKRKNFISNGPNWVLSLDGHDKLMGYQNWTFPLAIYGCMDTASRKLLWLHIWDTNSKPELIGRWYLEHLYECRTVPAYLRIDKGTETGVMATMQAYLRRNHDDLDDSTDSIIYVA